MKEEEKERELTTISTSIEMNLVSFGFISLTYSM